MFQTDPEDDVIFVCEKSASKCTEITIDQVKLLALQRDIDQESLPKQPDTPLMSQRSVAVGKLKIKMEEEEWSEEKVLKTGKKSKKETSSLLLKNKNSTVDDSSLTVLTKEKKKCKKVDTVVVEEGSLDGYGEKEKKKKKKKLITNESLNGASGSDVTDGLCKKKKKVCDDENADSLVKEEEKEVEKKLRKEKLKKNFVQFKPEHINIKEEEGHKEQDGNDKVSKKTKKKNSLLVETEEKVNKKRKKKHETAENMVKLEMPEEPGEGDEVQVKKKKKKSVQTKDEYEKETPKSDGNNKRKSPGKEVKQDKMFNKKKDKSTKSEIIIIDDEKTELKSQEKKEKNRKALPEENRVEEPKKKKGKKRNGGEVEPSIYKVKEVQDVQNTEPLITTNKKGKKKKLAHVENRIKAKTAAKKKLIKEEVVEEPQDSSHVDVVFLSEKSGNTDEERRQALQVEIDEASHPQRTAKPSGFGQWGTAQFDSSDQQQKFLRLMGGFKKGFQPAAASTRAANMALGKEAQQQLQHGLLGEFERAQSRRMDFSSRGAGLGFTAPSNKKFSIDINKRRSVHFDD